MTAVDIQVQVKVILSDIGVSAANIDVCAHTRFEVSVVLYAGIKYELFTVPIHVNGFLNSPHIRYANRKKYI